ncbi:hypothetical protein JHD48_06060 [Sulfurimonas sp. SAG-AH-194-I05]|nr:hypothetical protein [Sulfurimonas sp. SAG-AH-194-I05]MDF1875291.1 hypothetical protein [Sulfurimonas sp. SAG-AH-194-I05]
MKPLDNVAKFLKRFDHFKNGELRSIDIIDATTMLVTLAGQDEARAFDWVSMKLEFTDVKDARLLENAKLSLLDMENGISIIKNRNTLAFTIGECYNISNLKSATCYIESTYIKYEEDLF